MNKRLRDLREFQVERLNPGVFHLGNVLCISGWLSQGEEGFYNPWRRADLFGVEAFTLRWETKALLELGSALRSLITGSAVSLTTRQILLHTPAATLASALVWPLAVIQAGDLLIDNPWSIGLDRAQKAGKALAEVLLTRSVFGGKPVDLFGYSLGALVIWEALKVLHESASKSIVNHVLIMGLPAVVNEDEVTRLRSVVAGRFIHAYSKNDWVLSFLYRASQFQLGSIAGLGPIEGLESVNLSNLIRGHLDYESFPVEILEMLLC